CRRRRVSFISDALLAGRESLSRHNTIDGVVMLAESRGPRLLGPDNGEAGAAGQRAVKAFPESFAGVKRMFVLTPRSVIPANAGIHNRRWFGTMAQRHKRFL